LINLPALLHFRTSSASTATLSKMAAFLFWLLSNNYNAMKTKYKTLSLWHRCEEKAVKTEIKKS
jgi:hypothetical protein